MLTDWFARHPVLGSGLATLAFCLFIALALATVYEGFVQNLVISFCIGLSIFLSSITVQALLGNRVPSKVLQLLAVPAGLALGLGLSGVYLSGDPRFFFSGPGRGGVGLGVLFGVLGALGFAAMHGLADLRRELELRRLQGAEQARQLATAQLSVLQAQMEPHFLFNTLSNVIGLIDVDPPRARALLEQLTQLLRASLRRTRQAQATVGDELDVVDAYLRIQQIRMGPRLQYAIDCPPDLRGRALPPLMLQPLVENAVRHGIEPAERGGRVDVRLREDGATLLLHVADTGLGVQPAAPRADGGTSLPNLRDRLRALYGDLGSLRLFANEPDGTIAEIRLPSST